MSENFGALILAAGKGTRMHSDTPKVLQPLLGEPMLAYVTRALSPLFSQNIWAVIGHGADAVRKSFSTGLHFVEQPEQLGTGHALMTAMPVLQEAGISRLLIINGDMPLITTDVLQSFINSTKDIPLATASLVLSDPGAYGRIIRQEGIFTGIVEARDYDPVKYGEPSGEINAGMYILDLSLAAALLPHLTSINASGEYYITELAELALKNNVRAAAIPCGTDSSLLGVNTPAELAEAEEILRHRIIKTHMNAGVIFHQPAAVCIGPEVLLEPGVVIHGPSHVLGKSHIAQRVHIDAFCTILHSTVHAGAHIRAYSHLQNAEVGERCLVGPYARLRPGSVMEDDAHAGNFVEMKKSRLGRGAKANHLSYLGDADIGAGSNIGAGTITCNYDGVHKHCTTIGERAFVGSNTSLVAPVTIGAEALIGAGSVITRDVPESMLAVARNRQVNLKKRK